MVFYHHNDGHHLTGEIFLGVLKNAIQVKKIIKKYPKCLSEKLIVKNGMLRNRYKQSFLTDYLCYCAKFFPLTFHAMALQTHFASFPFHSCRCDVGL